MGVKTPHRYACTEPENTFCQPNFLDSTETMMIRRSRKMIPEEKEVQDQKAELVELSLKERQEALLDLLHKISAIVEMDELRYFAYYGTLLGCIRHDGFIPWDDDIDLAMPRSDYERMQRIDWNAHGLSLISPNSTRDSPYFFSKIVDKKFVSDPGIEGADAATGLSIDFFPIDDYRCAKPDWRVHVIHVLKRLSAFKFVRFRKSRALYKNLLLVAGKLALLPLPIGTMTRMADRLAQSRQSQGHYAGCLAGPYRRREILPKAAFAQAPKRVFGNTSIPVPAGYETILNKLYGDYMKLPPPEKRTQKHVSIVYRKRCT